MPQYLESFSARDGTSIQFRSLIPSDAAAFCSFLDQVSLETSYTNEYPGALRDPAKIAQGLLHLQDNPALFWIGAFLKGEPPGSEQGHGKGPVEELVGFLAFRGFISGEAHPFFQHIFTFDLMVLKKVWGLGLGSRFMTIIDEISKKHGVGRVEALVKEGNTRAQALYKKHGYQTEGTRRKSVCIDGKYIDEYYVAKLYNAQ